MAKSDKKIHEYRMSGARWIMEIAKSEGIEAAEKELEKRGSMFIPMEVDRDKLVEVEKTIAEQTYQTVISTVLGLLVNQYGFGKKRLKQFKERFDSFCADFFRYQPCGEPYVKISDYAKMLKEEYDVELNVDICLDVEKSR